MKLSKGEDQMGPCKNPIKESNTQALSSLSFISSGLFLTLIHLREFAHLRRMSPLLIVLRRDTSLIALASCSHSYNGQNMGVGIRFAPILFIGIDARSLLSVSITGEQIAETHCGIYTEYFNIYLGKDRV